MHFYRNTNWFGKYYCLLLVTLPASINISRGEIIFRAIIYDIVASTALINAATTYVMKASSKEDLRR